MLVPAASGDGPTAPEQQDPAVASRLAEWLSELMRWSATQPRPLAFAATASAGASLPACLRAAGCLDAEAKVPALGPAGRTALLLSGLRGRGVHYSGSLSHLQGLVGEQLEGYGARDVALLADRAVHAALSRQLLNTQQQDSGAVGDSGSNSSKSKSFLAWRQGERDGVLQQQQQQHAWPQVTAEDVAAALSDFVPAALWRAGQHGGRSAGQGGDVAMQGWEDVGACVCLCVCIRSHVLPPSNIASLISSAEELIPICSPALLCTVITLGAHHRLFACPINYRRHAGGCCSAAGGAGDASKIWAAPGCSTTAAAHRQALPCYTMLCAALQTAVPACPSATCVQ